MVWLRNVALAAAAFGGSWGGAIWFWRETNRMPATGELVLYLLVLPVALLGAWWLGRKAWTRATTAAAPAAATGTASAAAEIPATAALPVALTIAATAVRAPHGESVAELRAALSEHRARPQLDGELYDDDGYPILSARLADAGEAALREELEQWRTRQQLDDPLLDLAQWRALAAASAVVADLVAEATLHEDLEPWLQQQQARQQGRLPPDAVAAPTPPTLQLLSIWPQQWTPAQRDLGWQWLRHLATQAGWPQTLIAPVGLQQQQDDDAGALLAHLLQRAGNPQQPLLALVIAADSHLSDSAINLLSNKNTLYTANRPQGHIPGEGAAGLLLADAAVAQQIGAVGSVLQAVHIGRRHESADTVKRDTDTCLASAITDVLKAAQVDGAAIELVTADTGHRTSRVTELMHVVTAAAPQLDPGADVISVGASSGNCGAVSWLTALALADAEAQQRGGPALSISNEDPYRRCAALVRPASVAHVAQTA